MPHLRHRHSARFPSLGSRHPGDRIPTRRHCQTHLGRLPAAASGSTGTLACAGFPRLVIPNPSSHLCPMNAAQACPELSRRALLPARRRQAVGGACLLPAPLPFVLTPLVAHPGNCPACPGLSGTWSEGVRPFLPSSFDFRLASTTS